MFIKKISLNKIIWVIFVFYLFTIIAFGDRVEYFKYSNITFVVLMGFMALYVIKQSLVVPKDLFMFLPFLIYSFLSTTWSFLPNFTIQRSITMLRLFVLLVIMAFYLLKSKQTEMFIYGFSLAGIIILVYLFYFYGFIGLRKMISDGARVGGDFVNSNTLAIYLSFSSIIFLYLFLNTKKWYYLVLAFGLVLVIASTGSKKGLLDLAVGYLLVFGFNQGKSKGMKKIFKWTVVILVFLIVLYFLWNSPLFTTVRIRFERMIGFLSGTGAVNDFSTRERQVMISIGWKQFLDTPILGIGIGASGYLTSIALGTNTYLHNDYVELLATGGIIGLLLQYIPIIYIFVKNLQYRKISKASQLSSILMTIYIVNSIAAVQYFSKLTYVIFAIALACYLENRSNERNINSHMNYQHKERLYL